MDKRKPTPVAVIGIVNVILTLVYSTVCILITMGLSCIITPIPAVIVCGIGILVVRKKCNLFLKDN